MKLPEIEISIKYKNALKSELRQLRGSKDVAECLRLIFDPGKIDWCEEFVMLCLNQNNKVIGFYRVSSGGQTASVADIRVIATVALNCTATQVVISHNHPSGGLTPSNADKAVTEKIKNGLAMLDIKLLDHIILTGTDYLSFADEGLI